MVGPLSVGFPTSVVESLWAGCVSHGKGGAVLGVFAGLMSTHMTDEYIEAEYYYSTSVDSMMSLHEDTRHHIGPQKSLDCGKYLRMIPQSRQRTLADI